MRTRELRAAARSAGRAAGTSAASWVENIMLYANGSDSFTYSDGSIGVRTYGPFGTWAMFRHVLCSDGKRRTVYCRGYADTFFSIPAFVTVRKDGKRYTVAGYATFDENGNPAFRSYTYRKNGAILA